MNKCSNHLRSSYLSAHNIEVEKVNIYEGQFVFKDRKSNQNKIDEESDFPVSVSDVLSKNQCSHVILNKELLNQKSSLNNIQSVQNFEQATDCQEQKSEQNFDEQAKEIKQTSPSMFHYEIFKSDIQIQRENLDNIDQAKDKIRILSKTSNNCNRTLPYASQQSSQQQKFKDREITKDQKNLRKEFDFTKNCLVEQSKQMSLNFDEEKYLKKQQVKKVDNSEQLKQQIFNDFDKISLENITQFQSTDVAKNSTQHNSIKQLIKSSKEQNIPKVNSLILENNRDELFQIPENKEIILKSELYQVEKFNSLMPLKENFTKKNPLSTQNMQIQIEDENSEQERKESDDLALVQVQMWLRGGGFIKNCLSQNFGHLIRAERYYDQSEQESLENQQKKIDRERVVQTIIVRARLFLILNIAWLIITCISYLKSQSWFKIQVIDQISLDLLQAAKGFAMAELGLCATLVLLSMYALTQFSLTAIRIYQYGVISIIIIEFLIDAILMSFVPLALIKSVLLSIFHSLFLCASKILENAMKMFAKQYVPKLFIQDQNQNLIFEDKNGKSEYQPREQRINQITKQTKQEEQEFPVHTQISNLQNKIVLNNSKLNKEKF